MDEYTIGKDVGELQALMTQHARKINVLSASIDALILRVDRLEAQNTQSDKEPEK